MNRLYTPLTFVFTVLISMNVRSQEKIAGEYYLRGVMETASGFKLDSDSTFEFFFSYGMLDRHGSGTWSVENNKIILNSKPYPGNDFKMIDSTTKDNDFITVKIEEKNTSAYSFVHCLIKAKDGDSLVDADREGVIVLPKETNTIRLVSEFASERISSFAIDHTKNNYFTFNFEPWVMEVFFKNFSLQFVNDHLEGQHPLLKDKTYEYVK